MQIQHRELRIDATRADEKTRTVSASLSSEEPVSRAYGYEVLSHKPGAVDLSRAAGGLPLLFNHDPDQVIGIAEDVRLDGRKLRARLRFAKTDRASEIWQLVTDGMLRGISIGYAVDDLERTGDQDGMPVFTATRWQVIEATATPVPADFKGAGIGRSTLTLRGGKMTETASNEDQMKLGIEAERQRVRDIGAVVEQFPHLRRAADQAIREGTSFDDFNRQALHLIGERAKEPGGQYTGPSYGGQIGGDTDAREHRAYTSPVTRRNLKHFAGETRQQQEQNAHRAGMWARAALFGDERAQRWVRDYGGGSTRALSTSISGKGSTLVPVEMADAVINLREEYGVARQELRVMAMGSDTMTVPRRTGGLQPYYVAQNAVFTESDASWDDVNLAARKLGVLTKMSVEVSQDATIDLASWLAQEIAYSFAEAEDDACFNGDGSNTYGGIYGIRPKLIDGNHGAGAVDAASGHDTLAEIDADDLLNLMAALPQFAHKNARWFCSQPAYQLVFQALGMAAGGATMIETGSVQMRSFAGYPIVISQKMPTSTGSLDGEVMLLFGDLSMAGMLGDRMGMEVEVLRERYAEYGQIGVIGFERYDVNIHDLGDGTTAGPVVGLVGNS